MGVDEAVREPAALEASARLAAVVNASPDAIVALDPSGIVRALNPAAERLLGRRAADAVGRAMPELVGGVEAWDPSIETRVRAGEAITGLIHRIRRGEATVALAWSMAAVRDADGTFLGTSAVARDVTEDLRREEGLARAEARARALAGVSGALADVSLDFRATWEAIARALAEEVGDGCLVREASLDERMLATVAAHHRDPAAYANLVDAAARSVPVEGTAIGTVFRTGRPVIAPTVHTEETLVAATAEAFTGYARRAGAHSVIAAPIPSGGRVVGTIVLVRDRGSPAFDQDDLALVEDCARRAGDAVERARLFDEARGARRAAERARARLARLKIRLEREVEARTAELHARLEDVELMTYAMSHELRQAIRHVDANAALVVEDYGGVLDDAGRARLARLRATARRMDNLVDTLLDAARLARPLAVADSVDLSALAQETAEQLRRRDPARVVEFVVEPGLEARGDPSLLRMALRHLLENAWKFTSPHPTARIEFGAERARGAIVYFVRDDGIGFDMAYVDLLFRPLYQLNPPTAFEGSGMGLPIIGRVVERHGGRVWAEGAIEQGATFRFTLGASRSSAR